MTGLPSCGWLEQNSTWLRLGSWRPAVAVAHLGLRARLRSSRSAGRRGTGRRRRSATSRRGSASGRRSRTLPCQHEVERVRRRLDRQHHRLALQRVELDDVLPVLEQEVPGGVDGPRSRGKSVVSPDRPHVVAVEVRLVDRDAGVDQPDELPGARCRVAAERCARRSAAPCRTASCPRCAPGSPPVVGEMPSEKKPLRSLSVKYRGSAGVVRGSRRRPCAAARPLGVDVVEHPQPLALELALAGRVERPRRRTARRRARRRARARGSTGASWGPGRCTSPGPGLRSRRPASPSRYPPGRGSGAPRRPPPPDRERVRIAQAVGDPQADGAPRLGHDRAGAGRSSPSAGGGSSAAPACRSGRCHRPPGSPLGGTVASRG